MSITSNFNIPLQSMASSENYSISFILYVEKCHCMEAEESAVHDGIGYDNS
jgi:hypothetical protein